MCATCYVVVREEGRMRLGENKRAKQPQSLSSLSFFSFSHFPHKHTLQMQQPSLLSCTLFFRTCSRENVLTQLGKNEPNRTVKTSAFCICESSFMSRFCWTRFACVSARPFPSAATLTPTIALLAVDVADKVAESISTIGVVFTYIYMCI